MKLGIVTNSILTSIDFYRTMGFWQYFTDCEIIDNPNWWNIKKYDVILVSRPYTVHGIRACEIAKEFGRVLWVDFDDDVLCPNPDFKIDEKAEGYVIKSCKLADLIICSTEEVENAYKEFGRTKIRENYFNDYLYEFNPIFNNSTIAGYRGLERYHRHNLKHFMRVFSDSTLYGEPVKWLTWGADFWWLDNTKSIGEVPFVDYMCMLKLNKPGVIFKPLTDILFNRAKSNITWLEATYAGGVCLAPDWGVWREDGIINYSSVDDAIEKLEHYIVPENRKEMFDLSVKTIKEKYLLSNVGFREKEYGL